MRIRRLLVWALVVVAFALVGNITLGFLGWIIGRNVIGLAAVGAWKEGY